MVHLVARGGLEDRELVRGEAAAKAVSAETAPSVPNTRSTGNLLAAGRAGVDRTAPGRELR